MLVSDDSDDFGPFALVDPLGFEYEWHVDWNDWDEDKKEF